MKSRILILKIFFALGLLALVVWIGLEIYRGNYLEAVAISGVGSLLLWFALGLGNQSNRSE